MANYDAAQFVGHGTSEVDGSYDPGATSGGKQEHIIAEKITDKAVALCRAKGLNIHRDEQNYKDNDLAGNTYNYKYAQSIHLNAGGGTRAEIYVPCKDKYLDAEFYMLSELEKIGLKNGGVKSRDYNTEKVFMRTNGVALPYSDYYGEIARAYSQGVSLDIIEIGFIDSSDVNIIENNIDRIATIIANGVLMVCGKSLYMIETENPNTNNGERKLISCLFKWIPSEIEKYKEEKEIIITNVESTPNKLYDMHVVKNTNRPSREQLFDMYVDGKKVLISCLFKWIPNEIKRYQDAKEIKIVAVGLIEEEPLYNMYVDGKQVLVRCLYKWIPNEIEKYEKSSNIIIEKCN